MSACNSENVRHLIGNPMFALETNLSSVRRRIQQGKSTEALELLDSMQTSIERIKTVLAELSDDTEKTTHTPGN